MWSCGIKILLTAGLLMGAAHPHPKEARSAVSKDGRQTPEQVAHPSRGPDGPSQDEVETGWQTGQNTERVASKEISADLDIQSQIQNRSRMGDPA